MNTSPNMGQSVGTLSAREPDTYNVGDTISLVNFGYSLSKHHDGMILNHGNQLIEVEVKSVKTAKVTVE
jgi:hypothetical protein